MASQKLLLAVTLASPFAASAIEKKVDDSCIKAHSAVTQTWEDAFIEAKADTGKLLELAKDCMGKCPQPYFAECAMLKDPFDHDDPEESCKEPYNALHEAFGRLKYEGDKEAGEKLPELIKKCADACTGDKRIAEECVAFEGINEDTLFEGLPGARMLDQGSENYDLVSPLMKLSIECKVAIDSVMETEEVLYANEEYNTAAEMDQKELVTLSEECKKVCPGGATQLCEPIVYEPVLNTDVEDVLPLAHQCKDAVDSLVEAEQIVLANIHRDDVEEKEEEIPKLIAECMKACSHEKRLCESVVSDELVFN